MESIDYGLLEKVMKMHGVIIVSRSMMRGYVCRLKLTKRCIGVSKYKKWDVRVELGTYLSELGPPFSSFLV